MTAVAQEVDAGRPLSGRSVVQYLLSKCPCVPSVVSSVVSLLSQALMTTGMDDCGKCCKAL